MKGKHARKPLSPVSPPPPENQADLGVPSRRDWKHIYLNRQRNTIAYAKENGGKLQKSREKQDFLQGQCIEHFITASRYLGLLVCVCVYINEHTHRCVERINANGM